MKKFEKPELLFTDGYIHSMGKCNCSRSSQSSCGINYRVGNP
jgi:hypothetical protein